MDYEIDFLPVGERSSGDAITMRYGSQNSFWINVVDGGYRDTADTVVDHIRDHYGSNAHINNVTLSHADNDHAGGLVGVVEKMKVHNLWMNRPWLYAPNIIDYFHGNWTLDGLIRHIKDRHPYLVELEAIAKSRGINLSSAFQGTCIGQQFVVLAPSEQRYIRLLPDLDRTPQTYAEKKGIIPTFFEGAKDVLDVVKEAWSIETLDDDPPATSASNETSLVQLGVFGDRRILLTGDVGPEGLMEAYHYAKATGLYARPNFIQVPHHGSRRNVTPTALNAWLGKPMLEPVGKVGVAFCSVGKDADIYPRKKVKNAFMRRGYPVHATRGWTKRHTFGAWPQDGSWSASEAEAFSYNVED